jgi:hypothetical protein
MGFRMSYGQRALLVGAGVVGAWWLAGSVMETRFYSGAIPPQLELAFGLASVGTNWSPAAMVVRFEACGGAIFGITGATVEAIRKRGLEFFKDATQGRGSTDSNGTTQYQPWQESPLEDSWTRNGVWLGLDCLNSWRTGAIVAAAQAPGSYYAVGRNRMLFVIPSESIAVYTFRH